MMTITMYDLAGAEMDRRFSPFCWRSRMALAHKGLAVETVPCVSPRRTSCHSRMPAEYR
jgi:hypothetical protein